jgi:hypothetical protein
MTLEDVKQLIKDEKNGEQVVSWHSKFIWDKMKFQVRTDNDAIKLSTVMRKNLHYILTVFSLIAENKGEPFMMRYLNPEYAKFDYNFTQFDPLTGEFKAKQFTVDSKNTQSNAERYIRVSFESLKEYSTKGSRRNLPITKKSTLNEMESLLTLVRNKDYSMAEQALKEIIEEISTSLMITF